MGLKKKDNMKHLLSFCDKTKIHLKKIANPNVIIGIKGGGCNGLKYYIKSHELPEKNDEVIQFDDFKVIICGKSLLYLIGTHFAWKEDNFGSGIIMENPNATSQCGCGETFNIK